jgi:hypothetical protein
MTLTEIANNIFLAWKKVNDCGRMEISRFSTGQYAWRAGNRVKVPYKSFWNPSSFTRVEVEAYLAWLDAGITILILIGREPFRKLAPDKRAATPRSD